MHHSWGKIPHLAKECIKSLWKQEDMQRMYIDSKIYIHTTSTENKGQLSCMERRKTKRKLATVAGITQCKRQASFSGNFDRIQSATLHDSTGIQMSRRDMAFLHVCHMYSVYFSHCYSRNMTVTHHVWTI